MIERSNHISMLSNPNFEIVQVNNFSDSQNPQLLEKYNRRRLYCYASPQISAATIPKEFIIDTSELRTIRKDDKTPGHTQSQY